MFRIHTPASTHAYLDPQPSTSTQLDQLDLAMADDFLDHDDAGRPVQLEGGDGAAGRVTGPGEVIADAGRWMRFVLACFSPFPCSN